MKVINAGLILIITAIGFFTADMLRIERIQKIVFDRMVTNANVDVVVKDVLDSAVMGIDEAGEAVISQGKAEAEYTWLTERIFRNRAEDWTAFILFTGNEVIDGKGLEEEALRQIKTVNKRLNYNLLFTEQVSSFRYNSIEANSLYVMFMPKFSNMIRLENDDLVYTLSGARIE